MSRTFRLATAFWCVLAIAQTLLAVASLIVGIEWVNVAFQAALNWSVVILMRGITNRDRQIDSWRKAAAADIRSGLMYVRPEDRERVLRGLER